MKELTLEIGGLPTTIVVPEEPIAAVLLDRYSAFLVPGSTDESVITVELLGGSLEHGYRVPTIDITGDTLTVTRHDLHAHSPDQGRTWHARMIANEYTFDSCLRVLYTLRLLRHGGFLVHASAQIRSGAGCIFTGKSEAGKSTISRLGVDNLVLCDELPLIRRRGGHVPGLGHALLGRVRQGHRDRLGRGAGALLPQQGSIQSQRSREPGAGVAPVAADHALLLAGPRHGRRRHASLHRFPRRDSRFRSLQPSRTWRLGGGGHGARGGPARYPIGISVPASQGMHAPRRIRTACRLGQAADSGEQLCQPRRRRRCAHGSHPRTQNCG